MKTPISDFIKKYSLSNPVRLHMPGHKGDLEIGVENFDITEIDGADELFHPHGIIRESEQNAGNIFGAHTFYSVEGSSLSIRAMVLLATKYALKNGKTPCILAGRNAHKSFLSALSICNCKVEWLYPENNFNYLSCKVSEDLLDKRLTELSGKITAVYLTSPDYLGNVLDVARLSKVCRKHGILLLVDNAHGSYLKFLENSLHPIDLGADITADSAHKTLSALTGAGYLHVSKNAPDYLVDNAKECMEFFASTSPSYLILLSLDRLNAKLDYDYKQKLAKVIESIKALKAKLKTKGFCFIDGEPLKLTLNCNEMGYKGYDIAKELKESNIVCEFCDKKHLVLMFSVGNTKNDFEALEKALEKIKIKKALTEKVQMAVAPKQKMSLRQALLSDTEIISVESAKDRIVASFSLSCPPAVAIAVPGEIIDDSVINVLKEHDISTIKVVKE